MLEMQLPQDVLFIIDRMRSHGYSAHIVGGSVRDSLIGRQLGDFDITTDALPEETKRVFSEYKTVDTGIKHGTVTLVLAGVPYEITTYRVDGDYKDNRHPESVTFTASLNEDLARRDFTVNAMAYAPDCGLVDPFGGVADAERRLIRAVGDPRRRFDEDALRILRALRFASVLSFTVDPATASAARELKERLTSISKERVYTELKKLISGDGALGVIEEFSDVLIYATEGLSLKKLPDADSYARADYLTRLCALIYLNSDDPIGVAERVLTALKTDKFTRTYAAAVFRAYENASFFTEREALITLAEYGREATAGALKLGALLGSFTERDASTLSLALSSDRPYVISKLAVRGNDLTSLGIKGEGVGDALRSLLFDVIDGRVENNKEALVEYLKKSL